MNETINPSAAPVTSTSAPVLPLYYYLDNFCLFINWVNERYLDLMNEEERRFISLFHQLDRPSQCLLVRMISRKGPWFRADKLRYAEIENHQLCAEQLLKAQLISIDQALSLEELAQLLTKAELLQLFSQLLRGYKAERKEILVALLQEFYPAPQSWREWTQDQFGKLYRLDIQPIINNFLLLFFGNPYQDLTEFVLQDLGLYRYETYAIDEHHRMFHSREELLQYQHLILLRELLAEAETPEALDALKQQIPAVFSNPNMERRRAKLINQLAYEFERHNQLTQAMELYQQSTLPPARERKIRLLEKNGHYDQAWQLLTELLNNPVNEQELQIAERMTPRIAKKVALKIPKKSPAKTLEQHLVLIRQQDDEGNFLTVEEIARQYFHTPETPCLYAENALFNGLFGLWLWPEMFRSVQGAFANPFQMAPLDLYQDDFQQNRPGIKNLWEMLKNESHHFHIQDMWQKKYGIANHFVNWQFMDDAILNMALQIIPTQHLTLIFQRLLFDLKTNRSGLPDLIQFVPAQNSYRMIEIKGPGDRIQDNQARWLDFFNEHHIPAEVCYVSWQ